MYIKVGREVINQMYCNFEEAPSKIAVFPVHIPWQAMWLTSPFPWIVMVQTGSPRSGQSSQCPKCRLYPIRLLCPWNSPGKNTGVVSHSFLQGIFLTQDSNLSLPHCRQILYLCATREAQNQTTIYKLVYWHGLTSDLWTWLVWNYF